MREIRDTGRVIGVDRIAMMAALNITSELLSNESSSDTELETTNQAIDRMQSKIDQCLHATESLDF